MDYITTNFMAWSVIVVWALWFICDVCYVIAKNKKNKGYSQLFYSVSHSILFIGLVYGSFIILCLFMKNIM